MTADETVAATQQGVFKHNSEHGLGTFKVSNVQSNHDNHLQKEVLGYFLLLMTHPGLQKIQPCIQRCV